MTSPGRASAATRSTSVGTSVAASASRPVRAEVGHQPRDVELLALGDLVVLLGRLEAHPGGAVERLRRTRPGGGCGGWCCCAARRRPTAGAPGSGRAAPWIVSRTAVGWWAKSSITRTPPTSPRTSCRRFTPWKVAQPGRDLRRRRRPSAADGRPGAERVLHVVQPRAPARCTGPSRPPVVDQGEARAVGAGASASARLDVRRRCSASTA